MTIISATKKNRQKNKNNLKQSESVFGLSAFCRVLPDVLARCIVVLAFKNAPRTDITRRNSFDETRVKNGWRWQWAERKIDDEHIGQFIRKT